jgi:hypothetical protein
MPIQPPKDAFVGWRRYTRQHQMEENGMRQQQQRQTDSLRRVQDFLDAHAAELGSLGDSEGGKQLDDALAKVDELGNAQGTADLVMAGQIARRRALSLELQVGHMLPIARFARARLRGVPDFAALTRSGARFGPRNVVAAARAMATAATPHVDVLVQAGFPTDGVVQLEAAADAMQKAMVERANTQVGRVGATKGIEEQLRRGREAVAQLDALVRRQLKGDPMLLAAWQSARRVTAKPGATRVVAGAAAPAATTGPGSPVASAAPVALVPAKAA